MSIRTKLKPLGGTDRCTITVVTTPSDAVCTLTYDGNTYTSKTATVPYGTVINYSVSYTNYDTQTGSWTVTGNDTKYVNLSPVQYTLTVNVVDSSSNPMTADITLNGTTSSNVSTTTLTVTNGTTINYSIYKANYGTETGSVVMDSNKTLTCTGAYNTTTTTSLNTTNFSNVGSLSIDSNGYASGFTTSKYLITNSNASSLMSTTNFEVYVRFKCSNVSGSSEQFVIGNKKTTSSGYTNGVGVWVESSKVKCRASKSSTSYISYNGNISNNSWTTVKVTYNGTTYNCYVNGINVDSATKGALSWYATPICFGVCPYNDSGGMTGAGTYVTLDIKNCYLKTGSTTYNLGVTNTTYTYYWTSTIT